MEQGSQIGWPLVEEGILVDLCNLDTIFSLGGFTGTGYPGGSACTKK